MRHEQARATQPLLEALLEQRSGDGPEVLRDAADRLLREHAPWALALAEPAAALIEAAGNERDQRLFRSWSLHPDGRTFDELARQEDLPRRHVHKLVRRAESRVRQAFDASRAPLPWTVSTLGARLGAVARRDEVAAELDRLGAGKAPAAELLVWLAGPYSAVPGRPGWVATQPKQLVARTSVCLGGDGGVRRLVDVELELADLNIRAEYLVPWLRASGAAVVHDVVVSVSGPLADVVERLLDAHGAARTTDEIATDLAGAGRVVQPAALAGALGTHRFSRSSTGATGLLAWTEHECRAAQKPTSHRAPAAKARTAKAPAAKAPAAKSTGPARDDQGDQGQLWLWVRVDPEVLRGSEATVPVALVEGLGLTPLSRRTFSSRWGPVSLAYDTLQPTRGPVRAVALATGARVDDTLLLGFRTTGSLDVEVRRGSGQVGALNGNATAVANFAEIVSGGTQ